VADGPHSDANQQKDEMRRVLTAMSRAGLEHATL